MANDGAPRRLAAPAKINLGLHVLRRREDGYHDIQTVMLPIGLRDEITLTPTANFSFSCSDPSLPLDEDNLCVRAAHLLADRFEGAPRGRLHLAKRIPHGAGLGGGSSDAAACLKLMADVMGLSVEESDLHALAAQLGSDVPFFLRAEPALATGRGELLSPLHEYELPFPVVVAVPEISVSTAEAYGLVAPHESGRADLEEVVRSNDPTRWRSDLRNDFQEPIAKKFPPIERALRSLREMGAEYESLSGSGSGVFGIFASEDQARSAHDAMKEQGCRCWWGYSPGSGA